MKVMTPRIGDNVKQVEISFGTTTLEDNCHYLVKLNLDRLYDSEISFLGIYSRSGLLNLSSGDILGQIILGYEELSCAL